MNKIIISLLFSFSFCAAGFSGPLVRGLGLDFLSDECWKGCLLGEIGALEKTVPFEKAFKFGSAYAYGVDEPDVLEEIQKHHIGQFNKWVCQQGFIQKKDVGVKSIEKLPGKYAKHVKPVVQGLLAGADLSEKGVFLSQLEQGNISPEESFREISNLCSIIESETSDSLGMGFFQKKTDPDLEQNLIERVAEKGRKKIEEEKEKYLSKIDRKTLAKKAKKKVKNFLNSRMSSEST